MIHLKKIGNIFPKNDVASGHGLSVELSDLMKMRRYVPVMRWNRDKKSSSDDSGGIKSAFKGRGIEMEEIREYQFGDDIRDIDWRVTARMNTPYTKVYTQERNREIYVWLDLSPIMLFGSYNELKSVTAAKIAALIAWMALDNKDRFGCIIFDGQTSWLFRPKRDRNYIATICKKIADVSKISLYNEVNDQDARLKSLKMLNQHSSKNGQVFIISSFLFWNEGYHRELAYLARHNRLFLLNIYDKLERFAPPPGQYMADYAGEKLVFDSSSRNYQNNYEEYFSSRHREWQETCQQLKCQLIDFTQNSNIVGNLKIF